MVQQAAGVTGQGGRCMQFALSLALGLALLLAAAPGAAQQLLTVAAYPAVDKIIEAAIPAWQRPMAASPARALP